MGLVGFEDPLRPTVPAAVAECQAAGVRVVMITGDYPATAQSIARQAGLASWETVISGSELDRMSDEDLARRIRDVQVFARVVPERIIAALMFICITGFGCLFAASGMADDKIAFEKPRINCTRNLLFL